MKSHEQLFVLIQALNPSEKRYLKIEAEKGGGRSGQQYMELFRILESMEVYDGKLLRERFEQEAALKHLPVAKAYLTEVILRVLRAYHGEHLPGLRVSRLLDEVEVLLEKGQVAMAGRWMKKAVKLANKLGDLRALLRMCGHRRRILKRQGGKGMGEALRQLEMEETDLMERMGRQLRIRQIHDRFYALQVRKAVVGNASEMEALLPLLGDPNLQLEEEGLDPESRLAKCEIYAMYHQFLGQRRSVLQWFEKTVHLWEEFPEKRDLQPHFYLKNLLDYLDHCIELGEREKFAEHIGKVRVVKVRSPKEKARRFILGHHLQLRHHLNGRDFIAAAGLGPAIEKGLLKNKAYITPATRLTFSYNLLVLHFILENHTQALHWSELIESTPWDPTRTDIRETARLLKMIVLLDAESIDGLERELRRWKRQAPGAKRLGQVLTKGLTDALDQIDKGLYARLRTELEGEELLAGIGGKEIAAWLNSRIQGGAIRDYI